MSTNLDHIIVEPGELCFSQSPIIISTLLGSCVAITAWHSELKVGGMCHYLLPNTSQLKGRKKYVYAEFALVAMKNLMLSYAALNEYEVGIFGGSTIFSDDEFFNIGRKNIEVARDWMALFDMIPRYTACGGNMSRHVALNLTSGAIKLRELQL
ncbi:chemotaxis protein CheD [Oceanicoccus sp. KOV_DT_Chl]|uniref:chemotaxis protein CheD n=1 Tax=Oceanicoccus sp. KOV_DT_Chl TaxID=1904639 RepID=UPI000C79C7B6|nr:chemotaxis protein CheD [Oceanicoccus sp. KOV_DT_Chl]